MHINVVIAGYSTFSWALATQLREQIGGRLYFVLPEREQAVEASLYDGIVAVNGDITDTDVLDQLDLGSCHTFVAASREEEANVLAALYAKNNGAQCAYARVFEAKFTPLLMAVGIRPLQTSQIAAAFTAISILEPSVAELVSLTGGQFALEEIQVSEYPELIGCRLGNLQSEYVHIIAVAQDGDISVAYTTTVTEGAMLIIIYDKQIKKRLTQELRNIAIQAVKRMKTQ